MVHIQEIYVTSPYNRKLLTSIIVVILASFFFLTTQFSFAEPTISDQTQKVESPHNFIFEGFGEVQLSYFDFPEYFYRDRINGTKRDSRMAVGITKFAMSTEKKLGTTYGFIAALEFQHQGIKQDNEPNFLGPFAHNDYEGSVAGAVLLTQLEVYKKISDVITLYGGRFPVAFGISTTNTNPTDYLSTSPPDAETSLIPEDWSEYGVGLEVVAGPISTNSQIISGLDSSGFGSRYWVANGYQGRYGNFKFSSPAFVQRVDWTLLEGVSTGVSVYVGDTSKNRPTPALAESCPSLNNSKNVAPCGYVPTLLSIYDYHAQWVKSNWRGSLVYLWGYLQNAGKINKANLNDTTNLPNFYTPVSSSAFGASLEIGYNFLHTEAQQWEVFSRYQHYNTMLRSKNLSLTPTLFDQKVSTIGVSYLLETFFSKIDFSHRAFGSSLLNYEDTVTISSGFLF